MENFSIRCNRILTELDNGFLSRHALESFIEELDEGKPNASIERIERKVEEIRDNGIRWRNDFLDVRKGFIDEIMDRIFGFLYISACIVGVMMWLAKLW